MLNSRAIERARRDGFEDALVFGRPDPHVREDAECELAYQLGFKRGKEAVKRILAEAMEGAEIMRHQAESAANGMGC
jgi:hypothetical protein